MQVQITNQNAYYFKILICIGLLLVFFFVENVLINFGSNVILKQGVLVLFTGFRMLFTLFWVLKLIFEHVKQGVDYHIYLVYLFTAIVILILSFAFDYFFIYQIDNQSFKGLNHVHHLGEVFFRLLFFSTLFFTMQGTLQIVPKSNLAEVYVLLEALVTYISFIFFLSNFSSLRHTIHLLKKT